MESINLSFPYFAAFRHTDIFFLHFILFNSVNLLDAYRICRKMRGVSFSDQNDYFELRMRTKRLRVRILAKVGDLPEADLSLTREYCREPLRACHI